jgi:hypothetical protein
VILPNFIGIGAPKAGTTWLAKCLGEHPDVFMAAVKEVDFFKYPDFRDRLDLYASHFVGAQGCKAVGEFTVRYFAQAKVPDRIRDLLPNVRLLLSLRNPIDQVVSHYWHLRRQNFHNANPSNSPRTLEEAIERYPELLLSPARYATHLTRWQDRFPREQLLVILYDDIENRAADVLHRVFAFLEVDPNFQPRSIMEKGIAVRRGMSPRSEKAGQVHQRIYSGLVARIYSPLKRMIGTKRAARLKDVLRVREAMNIIFMREGYPQTEPATREHLQTLFADEIQRLQDILQLDLSHWK